MKTAAFTKRYGTKTVLDLPALELPEGMITAVIGPNGSGKSTLAKILSGIEASDLKERPLTGVKIGWLPQKSYAFRMSTARNIALNGSDTQKQKKLMAALQLEPLARQRAKKLSGGESSKMALARLLMSSYDLLILDEPTASMDMESTLISEQLIAEACRETGCAVLLITHSIQQARRLADRALFLYGGKILEQGPADIVLHTPETVEARRFLDFYGL